MTCTIIILNLIYVVSAISCSNLFLGYADPKSKLIYSRSFKQGPGVWMKVESITDKNFSKNEVISAIQILDLRADRRGDIGIMDGGLGANFVTIELFSPGTYVGLTFWVEIFAIPTGHFLYHYAR